MKTILVVFTLISFLFGCSPEEKPKMTPAQQAQLAQQQEQEALAKKQQETEKAVALYRSVQANQNVAIANARKNAGNYRDSNPRLEGTSIVDHPDPMISSDCLQGSGWIWISFMGKKNNKVLDDNGKPTIEKYKAYCSTHSIALGCYLEDDFKSLPYFQELKKCNIGIPLPFNEL